MNRIVPPPVTPLPATDGRLLRGKPLKEALLAQVPPAILRLPRKPHLVVVRVGDNSASEVYVAQKKKAAEVVGIDCTIIALGTSVSQMELESVLGKLAADDAVDAVILQLPLPDGLEKQRALDVIPPMKDVDGLTTASLDARTHGLRAHWPATPLGVVRLLDSASVKIAGAKVAVVGRSQLVGKPLAQMLVARGAELLGMVGRDTPAPAELVKRAEIVCVAAGQPGLVTEDWLKDGAVVVDIGISRGTMDGVVCLMGDVSPAAAVRARLVTPVPGGVGPMTVASLLTNVVDAAYWRVGLEAVVWEIPSIAASG